MLLSVRHSADPVLADPFSQDFGDSDASVGLLMVFQQGDQSAADRDGRPV